jgi:inosine/xanthosine triphosphatase
MRVVLGSQNPPKQRATELAFSAAFPDAEVTIDCFGTDSGVSAHPLSLDETLTGAINRANNVREQSGDADYYVGIEGGLVEGAGRVWEVGVVAVVNARGDVSTGISAGIEMRGVVLDAVRNGIELSDVIKQRFGIDAVGVANGFYGLATNDHVTRQAAYEQAVAFALAPYIHPEFYA